MVPVFEEGPQDILQLRDPIAVFNCSASGIPLPTITWNFQNGATSGPVQSTRVSVINGIIVAELTVHDITESDFGSYSCVANNLFSAVDSVTARLQSRKLTLFW